MSSKCECRWLPWITKCYGHCKKAKPVQQQQAQLFDLIATKTDQTIGDATIKSEAVSAVAKDAKVVEKLAKVDVSAAKRVEGAEKKCECFKSQLHYLKWVPNCKGLSHCPRAKKDKIVCDIKAAAVAAVQPEPVQLVDLTNAEEEETTGNTKSAARVFMEEKVKQTNALLQKLSAMEKENALRRQLLSQHAALARSQHALKLRKERTKLYTAHKFKLGAILSSHQPFIDDAIAEVQLRRRQEASDAESVRHLALVSSVLKLAPDGKYVNLRPVPAPPPSPRPLPPSKRSLRRQNHEKPSWTSTPFHFRLPFPFLREPFSTPRTEVVHVHHHHYPESVVDPSEENLVVEEDNYIEDDYVNEEDYYVDESDVDEAEFDEDEFESDVAKDQFESDVAEDEFESDVNFSTSYDEDSALSGYDESS